MIVRKRGGELRQHWRRNFLIPERHLHRRARHLPHRARGDREVDPAAAAARSPRAAAPDPLRAGQGRAAAVGDPGRARRARQRCSSGARRRRAGSSTTPTRASTPRSTRRESRGARRSTSAWSAEAAARSHVESRPCPRGARRAARDPRRGGGRACARQCRRGRAPPRHSSTRRSRLRQPTDAAGAVAMASYLAEVVGFLLLVAFIYRYVRPPLQSADGRVRPQRSSSISISRRRGGKQRAHLAEARVALEAGARGGDGDRRAGARDLGPAAPRGRAPAAGRSTTGSSRAPRPSPISSASGPGRRSPGDRSPRRQRHRARRRRRDRRAGPAQPHLRDDRRRRGDGMRDLPARLCGRDLRVRRGRRALAPGRRRHLTSSPGPHGLRAVAERAHRHGDPAHRRAAASCTTCCRPRSPARPRARVAGPRSWRRRPSSPPRSATLEELAT